jgi:hypothetical protein
MRELPILFSAPMVRAILEGRKTVTRRVVKPQPDFVPSPYRIGDALMAPGGRPIYCPYGWPGDRLWVRETWAVQRHEPCLPHERDYQDLISPVICYRADGSTRRIQGDRSTGVGVYHGAVEKNRVSIHMPRWASRITLEVTGVRVEWLNDISDDDAAAEGFVEEGSGREWKTGRQRFGELWDLINGAGSWDANPMVWVVEFKRVTP